MTENNEKSGAPFPPPPVQPGAGQSYSPPPGTYPAQDAPPAETQLPGGTPPAPPVKSRRVGTFTMALCLIATGVVLLLRLIIPGLDVVMIARFAPVVLVLLGAELLVASLLHKKEKLRFDILSVFISIVLILGSLAAAMVPEIYHYEVESHRVESRLREELAHTTRQALRDAGVEYTDVSWSVNLDLEDFDKDMTVDELSYAQRHGLSLRLAKDYASKEEFTADCRRSIDVVKKLAPNLRFMDIYSNGDGQGTYEGEPRYSLYLNDRYEMEDYYSELEKHVQVQRWHVDWGFMDETEYAYRLEEERKNPMHNGADTLPGDEMDEPGDETDETPEDPEALDDPEDTDDPEDPNDVSVPEDVSEIE